MRRILIIMMVLCITATAFAQAQNAVTIDDCFLRAVRRSEDLQIREETIVQASARYKQLLGNIMPQITFKASELLQDVPAADQAANAGSISNTFLRRDTPAASVNLTQPIFSGFKEWRAMAGNKATQARGQHERNRAAQLLYQDVAQSFYVVLQVQNDVAILSRQKTVLSSRVTELRERVGVGRSRTSEVASAEAQLANIEALLAEAKGTQAVAREMLEFLTGTPADHRLLDSNAKVTAHGLDHFLVTADHREDVLAKQAAVDEARNAVGVAQAGHWPTINMSANYYAYRVGFYNDVKWDTTFNLSLPIFTGGVVRAQIKEAESKLAASHLDEQLSRRQSEKDIRSAYATWQASVAQARAYSNAASKNKINFDAQRTDYQSNLVNNLEVTQAQSNWMDSERRANQLHHQARVNYVQLLVAAGRIPTMSFTSSEL